METFSIYRCYSIIIVLLIVVYVSTSSSTGVTYLKLDKRGPRVQVCQCGSMSLQKCMKVFLPACCVKHSSLGGSVACAPMGKKSMNDELISDQSSQYEYMDTLNKFNFIKNLLASKDLLNARTIPQLLQEENNEDMF